MRGISQDIADFLFHAAAVATGAALQACFHVVFKVSNYKLRHFIPSS